MKLFGRNIKSCSRILKLRIRQSKNFPVVEVTEIAYRLLRYYHSVMGNNLKHKQLDVNQIYFVCIVGITIETLSCNNLNPKNDIFSQIN